MNSIVRFDTQLTKMVQSLPPETKLYMSGITLCGSVLPIFITLGLGFLLSSAAVRGAFAFIVVSIFANLGLKQFLHRPRPDTIYVSLKKFRTHSFPSGHAFGSLTTYGFVAYFALLNLTLPVGFIIAALLWVLILLIGVSRIYLGAHYPTDVIGGWALGMFCLTCAILIS